MADDVAKDAGGTGEPRPSPWIPDTRTVIVCWMMVSSFGLIFLCWLKPPTGVDSQLLNTLIGMYVGTGFITAVNWWMGSAKGSDANNKLASDNSRMMDKLTDKVAAPPVAVVTPDALAAASLTNGQRTYYDTIADPEQKKKFLGMSDAERNAVIGKA